MNKLLPLDKLVEIVKFDQEKIQGANQWTLTLNSLSSSLYFLCNELDIFDKNIIANSGGKMKPAESFTNFQTTNETLIEKRVNTFIKLLMYVESKMKNFTVTMPTLLSTRLDQSKIICNYDYKFKMYGDVPKAFIHDFASANMSPEDSVILLDALSGNEYPEPVPKDYQLPNLFRPINFYTRVTIESYQRDCMSNHAYEMCPVDSWRFDVFDIMGSPAKSKAKTPLHESSSPEHAIYVQGITKTLTNGFLKLLALMYGFDINVTGGNISWIYVVMKYNLNLWDMDQASSSKFSLFPIIPENRENSIFTFSTQLAHQLEMAQREIHYGTVFNTPIKNAIYSMIIDVQNFFAANTDEISTRLQPNNKVKADSFEPSSKSSETTSSRITNTSSNQNLEPMEIAFVPARKARNIDDNDNESSAYDDMGATTTTTTTTATTFAPTTEPSAASVAIAVDDYATTTSTTSFASTTFKDITTSENNAAAVYTSTIENNSPSYGNNESNNETDDESSMLFS